MVNKKAWVGTHFDSIPDEMKREIEAGNVSMDELRLISNLANPGSPALEEFERYLERDKQ